MTNFGNFPTPVSSNLPNWQITPATGKSTGGRQNGGTVVSTSSSGGIGIGKLSTPNPVAKFSYTLLANGVVKFQDESLNSPSLYLWDFGDGSNSIAQNPYHQFAIGSYPVVLNVQNSSGIDSYSIIISIAATQTISGHVVSMTTKSVDFFTTLNGLGVLFTNLSNVPGDVLWNFGDSSTSSDFNAFHVYASAGTYQASLSIGSFTKSESVTVSVPTPSGNFINKFGTVGSGNGQFSYPQDVAVDSSYIYVTDSGNNRVQIFDKSTYAYVNQFGTSGAGNGEFNYPQGIRVDSSYIYVIDSGNNRVQIFDKATYAYVDKFGTSGSGNGQFNDPLWIEVDASYIYVTEYVNCRVQIFNKSTYVYVGKFGSSGSTDGKFANLPTGIGVDSLYIYVGCSDGRVQKFNKSTYDFVSKFTLPVAPTLPHNGSPEGLYVSGASIFLVDKANNAVDIYDSTNYLSSLKTFGSLGSGDGLFNAPEGIFSDTDNIYVADGTNNRVQIFSTITRVNYKPVASFTVSASSGDAPFTLNVTDTSTNIPTSWLYEWGDGTTSTTQNPSHTYANAGTYQVRQTATNASGSGTSQQIIMVTEVMATTGTPATTEYIDDPGDVSGQKIYSDSDVTAYRSGSTVKLNVTDITYSGTNSRTVNVTGLNIGDHYSVCRVNNRVGQVTDMRLYILYYDTSDTKLHAWWTSTFVDQNITGWQFTPLFTGSGVDCIVDSNTQTGKWCAAAGVDSSGVHVVYFDEANNKLKHATTPLDLLNSWTIQSDITTAGQGGTYCAIETHSPYAVRNGILYAQLAHSSDVVVVYQGASGAVKVSTRVGSFGGGSWVTSSLEASGVTLNKRPFIFSRYVNVASIKGWTWDYEVRLVYHDTTGGYLQTAHAYAENMENGGGSFGAWTKKLAATVATVTGHVITAVGDTYYVVYHDDGTNKLMGTYLKREATNWNTPADMGVAYKPLAIVGRNYGDDVTYHTALASTSTYRSSIDYFSISCLDGNNLISYNHVLPSVKYCFGYYEGVVDQDFTFQYYCSYVGTNATIAWVFSDGGSSSSQNPEYIWLNAAHTCKATVTATGPLGVSSGFITFTWAGGGGGSKTVAVLNPPVPETNSQSSLPTVPPRAEFTASYFLTTIGTTIKFHAFNDGTVTHFYWNFGDGTVAEGEEVEHAYSANGSYPVALLVENDIGWQSEATATIIIAADITPENNAPTAIVLASPQNGTVPLTVAFTANVSTPDVFYAWDFGDGGTSELVAPSHTFTTPGTKTVTLTVKNVYGSTSSSIEIVVAQVVHVLSGDDYYYVLDKGNDRVIIYTIFGKFLRSFGGHGTGPGLLINPTSLCVNWPKFT